MFSGVRRVEFSCRDRFAYQKSLKLLRRAIFQERTIIAKEVAQKLVSFRGDDVERRKMIAAHPALQRRLVLEVGNPNPTRQQCSILAAVQVSDLYVVGFANHESNPKGHEFWFKDYEGPKDITVEQTPLKFDGSYIALGGVPGYTEAEVARDSRLGGKLRVSQSAINEAIDNLSRWEYRGGFAGNLGADMAALIIVLSEAARNTRIEAGVVRSFRSAENQSGMPQLSQAEAKEEFTSWDRMSRQETVDLEKYPIARLQIEEIDNRASAIIEARFEG
jgi:Ribosome inactivating protein